MLKLDLWGRLGRSGQTVAAEIVTVLVVACASVVLAPVSAARAVAVSRSVVVVTNTSDVVNGDVSSIASLNARPGRDGISLREALEAADHTRGNATVYVTFSAPLNGKTIAPRSELPPISRNHVVLEGVAPNGAPGRVTIDGSREPSSTRPSHLLLVQTSDVTVRWLRLIGENPQGTPAGGMRALVVSAGVPPSGARAGSSTIAHVQILDDVFDGHQKTPGSPTIAVAVGGGVPRCCIGRYSDITVARNTFVDQAVDGEGIAVLAANSGMRISGVVIEDNTIHDDIAIELGTGGTATRLAGIQIIGNTITDSGGANGIGIGFDASGAINATIDGTLIEDNTIFGFGNGNAINISAAVLNPGRPGFPPHGDVTSNTQIVNNVIRQDNISPAIDISGGVPSASGVSGVTIENDTLVNDTGAAGLLSEFPGAGGNYITGVVLRNTILYDPNGMPIAHGTFGQPPNVAVAQAPDGVANSLISGPGWAGSNGNINANPGFVNEAGGDYHLAAGSPAINAGTTIGAPAFDFDGARRDAQPDIGAYEYGTAPRPLLTVTVYPLGGNGTITSNPAAIGCGTTCSAQLDANSKITLTAKPDSRSRFLGWKGVCSGTRRCTVRLTRSKSVTARFGPR